MQQQQWVLLHRLPLSGSSQACSSYTPHTLLVSYRAQLWGTEKNGLPKAPQLG